MARLKKEYSCALVLTHDLIGGKWKLRILWHIIHGDNRFSLLMKCIPDISQKVLVSQLQDLGKKGIIERIVVDDNPPKVIIYKIMEKYKSLIPVIDSICEFSETYARESGITITDKE